MNQEQRNEIMKAIEHLFKILLLVLAWFAVQTFMQIRDDIHQLSADVTSIKERLIRVETKLEDQEKYSDNVYEKKRQ